LFFVGLDIGSSMTKVVIINEHDEVIVRILGPTGAEHRRLANKVMQDALQLADLTFDKISYVMATGYGRLNVPFADRQMSEITCQAAGVHTIFPGVKTAIDIGGQDAKGLKIDRGRLVDFVMNDKCAAGTGRFLEVLAETLGIRVEDFGNLSLQAKDKVVVNNICTVFARDEITARISEGKPIADVIAGVHDAIAGRVVNMVKRIKIEPEIVFTAGLATNIGVVKAMEQHTGFKVSIPPNPFTTVALGAAVLGKQIVFKSLEKGEPIKRKERSLEEARFFSSGEAK